MQQFSVRKNSWLRPLMAGGMAGFILLLGLFASSSTLHYAVHDSSSSNHDQCVICSVAQGQLEAPIASQPVVSAPVTLISFLPAASILPPPSFDYSVALSRGPPVS